MHFPFMCFKVQLRPSLLCLCTVQCKNLFRCLSHSSLSEHTSQNNVHTSVAPDALSSSAQWRHIIHLLTIIHVVDKHFTHTCYSHPNTNKGCCWRTKTCCCWGFCCTHGTCSNRFMNESRACIFALCTAFCML